MNRIVQCTVLAAAVLATAAIAGSPVYGYGSTRADAAEDAERAAKEESYRRHGKRQCYTPLKPQDCRKDDGGWVCEISVANHLGSC